MPQRIFIGVAWPYANDSLHLGHMAGAYLPADIFARYHRTRGDEVLMVSGSDAHGTPITIRAEQEGVEPHEVLQRFHQEFLWTWQQMGIGFDLYTSTETENHYAVAQEVFLDLYHKGYIVKGSMRQPYCPKDQRFLPDRYVEGTCPFCGNPGARGDQCDRCGRTLDPEQLVAPRCRLCGATPEIRDSEHFFLRLGAFQEKLLHWLKDKDFWRPHVLNFTQQWLAMGLQDRAITRDILWGVPVPLPGYESKRIYVWFEAVIGYLSAAIQWARDRGEPEAWRAFWQDPTTRSYYFIGKDNIPFHTIIWPAMLMGYGDWDPATGKGAYNLPYDVPANEFLSLEGRKFSKSQNWAVWMPDYLARYDPDPLRYYLAITMPEVGDADFSWSEFLRRTNDELVATYGNLVHRVLTFTYRNFEGRVPEPGPLGPDDQALIARTEAAIQELDGLLERVRLKDGIRAAMALAQEANRYLDARAPWRLIKEDRQACATVLWTVLVAISGLRTIMYPYLPFTSAALHTMMGFPGTVEASGWRLLRPSAGQALQEPKALFKKLEERVVEEEMQRLGT